MADRITDGINEWLLQYPDILNFAEVNTEELPDNTHTLALRRSGVVRLPLKYITKSGWFRQYQYELLLKTPSESNEQRLDNLDWLDDLSNWIEQKQKRREFPNIEQMKVTQISCANGITYETDEETGVSTYYIQLYFNIEGGN